MLLSKNWTLSFLRKMIGGGGGGYAALRLRSLSNGGSHRVTLTEVDFLASGSEISKSGTTAFEGGSGSINGPASNAFDDFTTTHWSRVSTDGTCYVGLRGYSPGANPTGIRVVTANWGAADAEAPVTFKIEGSNDTTDGTDGTWTDLSGTKTLTGLTSSQQTFTFDPW